MPLRHTRRPTRPPRASPAPSVSPSSLPKKSAGSGPTASRSAASPSSSPTPASAKASSPSTSPPASPRGAPWPDQERREWEEGRGGGPFSAPPQASPSPPLPTSPSSVLLLTAEDDFADTVRPRLEALGADCDRILGIATVPGDDPQDVPRTFALNRDIARLRDLLDAMPDCRLIVIDPISAYLGHQRAPTPTSSHFCHPHHDRPRAQYRHPRRQSPPQERRRRRLSPDGQRGLHRRLPRRLGNLQRSRRSKRSASFSPSKTISLPTSPVCAYTIETSPDHRAPTIRWSPEPVTASLDFAIAAARAAGRPDEERQYAINWLKDRLAKAPIRASDIA